MYYHVQVYLVAGGYTGSQLDSSTELLVHGASFWSEAAPLPHAMKGLKIISIDNKIISSG